MFSHDALARSPRPTLPPVAKGDPPSALHRGVRQRPSTDAAIVYCKASVGMPEGETVNGLARHSERLAIRVLAAPAALVAR